MNHTPQIREALRFAARKHHGQLRIAHADGPMPFIVHPFSVALLVAEDGAHDDVVTAALLHDTIEDTATTREELANAFNEQIALLVDAVSECKERDGRVLDWEERKRDYLMRIEASSVDAVVIVVADKIDNIESRIEEYEREGEAFFAHWSQSNDLHLWFHGEVLRIAQARMPEHPLTHRLAETHARQLAVFGK